MNQNILFPGDRLAEFCRANGIASLAVFGSALRDDFGPQSDIDLLVEFEPGQTPGLRFVEHRCRTLGPVRQAGRHPDSPVCRTKSELHSQERVFSFRNFAQSLSRYLAEVWSGRGQLVRLVFRIFGGVSKSVQDVWRDVSAGRVVVAKLAQEAPEAAVRLGRAGSVPVLLPWTCAMRTVRFLPRSVRRSSLRCAKGVL